MIVAFFIILHPNKSSWFANRKNKVCRFGSGIRYFSGEKKCIQRVKNALKASAWRISRGKSDFYCIATVS
ncbi:unknown [Paraprevotella clara CAG:116]|nr:unknown [Paraprevotella clara CAG:116]